MRRVVGAALALASTAAVAIAASAGLARVQITNPQPSYPVEPRTATGKNPFAILPKPQECAPAKDKPATADYFRLSRLPRAKGENPFVRGAPATTVLKLVNRKGQQFLIFVSGGSAAAVRNYVQRASVCAEVIALKVAAPPMLVPVRISSHLVDAAVAATGRSPTALSALRDSLAAFGQASLSDVVVKAGGVVDDVLAAAIQATSGDLAARVAAGDFTDVEVAALDLQTLVKELALQPRAPFLTAPGDDAKTPAELGRLLVKHKRTAIAVGILPQSTASKPLPKRYIAWAAVDFARSAFVSRALHAANVQGPLGAGAYHYYVAKCQPAATAQIQAWVGAATLKLWRVSDWSDYATSYAAIGKSRRLYASWPSNRTYDTWVRGLVNNTWYSMYYSWTRGFGGGC